MGGGNRCERHIMTGLDAATVRARMTAPLVLGETVDLRGCLVEQPLDLTGAIIANVDVTGTRFRAPVTCTGATFAGLAWFKNCAEMLGRASFAGSELRGVGAFDAARFEAKTSFDDIQAIGNLSFASTVFADTVYVRRAVCCGGLWLNDTVFERGIDLAETEVHGRMWLHGTKLAAAPVTYGYTYRR
jgi:hypothetical protein